MSVNDDTGRATIKDVYEAVTAVRTELGGKIDDLAQTVSTIVTSHEHRLTVNEQMQATMTDQMHVFDTEQKKHADEIAALRDKQREDEAAAAAMANAAAKRSNTRRWIVGTVLTVLGLIATVSYILVGIH